MLKGKNILLGVTGGIAAYKAAYLASALKKEGADVQVILTESAAKFITPLTFETLTGNPVFTDTFKREASFDVAHITISKKTDVALIAPATANILAKMACGIADDMLTTTCLALVCPIFAAPAMNTAMYQNKTTQQNMEKLKESGIRFIHPGEGLLACGDTGVGRMAEPDEILSALRDHFSEKQDFAGVRMLITAGPTEEPIDPVRYLTNRSSGKMGYALAAEAVDRGAQVTLVSGPVCIAPPNGAQVISVLNAEEMYKAVMDHKKNADVIIKCAAVADYTPVSIAKNKIKKGESFTLELKATKDILSELGRGKNAAFLVGFAAETDHVLAYAKKKLNEKNIDMIVANDVSDTGVGFDSDENEVAVLHRDGRESHFSAASKGTIAGHILDEIQTGRNKGI
jgi:phosphopantothenoylcysteine decarboxylase/phosphopantothenate--cysteine ligase